MKNVYDFLKNCGVFYLATIDGNQARVRPFAALCIFENKLYICTNNTKPNSLQMKKNHKIEISGMPNQTEWIRVTAEAYLDENIKAKQAMLDAIPTLNDMYKIDDGIFEVFYLKNATANILSFTGRNETITF